MEWDHYGGILFGVTIGTTERSRVEGSAVMVAPGIALSARHVIEPYLDQAANGVLGILLNSVCSHGVDVHKVDQIIVNESDVCILRTSLASDLPPTGDLVSATMTTRIPKLGERLFLAGYRAQQTVAELKNIGLETRVAVGEVTAVYMNGRDSVMLPHPCIEVKTLTLGGMSGGPAFDEDGKVVGILSTSIEHLAGPSYVSMLWPILTNQILTAWPNGIINCPYNLIELGRKFPNLEKTEAFFQDDSGRWHYDPW